MIKYENAMLIISFCFLLFNGSALGFIFYQERLGLLFGLILFCGTSLLGALLATIAYETKTTYYSQFFFFGNLFVTLSPLYYWGVSTILAISL